jgi:hypothetical protein
VDRATIREGLEVGDRGLGVIGAWQELSQLYIKSQKSRVMKSEREEETFL